MFVLFRRSSPKGIVDRPLARCDASYNCVKAFVATALRESRKTTSAAILIAGHAEEAVADSDPAEMLMGVLLSNYCSLLCSHAPQLNIQRASLDLKTGGGAAHTSAYWATSV